MTKQQKQLLDYLRTKSAGDVVTEQEILAGTSWAKSTLPTYRSKHYVDPFLAYLKKGKYKILRNGSDVSEQDFVRAFTQVRPEVFVPVEGMVLEGESGTYELKAHVGNGAVGNVWRCVERGSGKQFAVKVLNPRPDLLDPKVINNVKERFAREAKYGRRLSHPNLIPYRDEGESEEHPFLVMDLAERSVATILKGGALPLHKTFPIVRACLSALEYLHGLGACHRDVKPANILQIGTRFLLGDLGIVCWSDMNPEFTSAGTITRDSLQLGSWYYMAPEQNEAPHSADTPADVYALGVSWYEMLTLKTNNPAHVAAKKFPRATEHDAVEAMIRRMMSFDALERPSIPELAAFVDSIVV